MPKGANPLPSTASGPIGQISWPYRVIDRRKNLIRRIGNRGLVLGRWKVELLAKGVLFDWHNDSQAIISQLAKS